MTMQASPDSLDRSEISTLRELDAQVRESFGPIARSAQGYIRSVVARENRVSLIPAEIQALQEVQKLDRELDLHKSSLSFMPGARTQLLADALWCLTEVKQGVSPRAMVFLATVCPDFSYDEASGTFLTRGTIHGGVGKVGKELLPKMIPIAKLLTARGLPLQLNMCYADIEAFDDEILRTAGVTRDAFLQRVRESRTAMQAFGAEALRTAGMEAEIVASSMHERLSAFGGAVSPEEIPPDKAKGLVRRRLNFYHRFYAEGIRNAPDPDEYLISRAQMAISQHINIGQSVLFERQQGRRVTLFTGSIEPLARYIKAGDGIIPVVRVAMEE